MKALLAIASVGTAIATFSAPASADPYDHFRFEHRDIVHVGWYCGPDQHLNRAGYCVWDHYHPGPFVIIRPFWR